MQKNNLISTKGFPIVFDGHNDVLSRHAGNGAKSEADRFLTGCDGAIDMVRARAGGFGGGFFAIYVRSAMESDTHYDAMNQLAYDLPLPDPVLFDNATPVAQLQVSFLNRLEEAGALRVCTSTNELRACMTSGKLAAIMHMEGAEAIDKDLRALDLFYRAGLRSLGPVWSRPTLFGNGVPFRFPGDGNIGEGLTEHGLRLINRCNELNIMIDLSHLNEAGFWDVAKHSDSPLVATHSNVYELCNSSRNLTDNQLEAIAESDGMVGVNFSVSFLRDDGMRNPNVGLEVIIRHFDYLIEKLGEDRVGFGSDYDGALVPEKITSVSDLPLLLEAMRNHGFDNQLLTKLCHGNWLRVLKNTWDE